MPFLRFWERNIAHNKEILWEFSCSVFDLIGTLRRRSYFFFFCHLLCRFLNIWMAGKREYLRTVILDVRYFIVNFVKNNREDRRQFHAVKSVQHLFSGILLVIYRYFSFYLILCDWNFCRPIKNTRKHNTFCQLFYIFLIFFFKKIIQVKTTGFRVPFCDLRGQII